MYRYTQKEFPNNDDNAYRLMLDHTVNAKNGDALPRREVEVSVRKMLDEIYGQPTKNSCPKIASKYV